jgi:hypothetical protein
MRGGMLVSGMLGNEPIAALLSPLPNLSLLNGADS